MKCIISYMARKMWDGLVEALPGCGFVILFWFVGIGAVYAFRAFAEWLGIEPRLLGAWCALVLVVGVPLCSLVELYREARRHCEDNPND